MPDQPQTADEAGCFSREITVDRSDRQVVNGITMTTEIRTVFDCSRWLSLVEAVVVAHALAHAGAITTEDLASHTAAHRGLRRVRQLDQVLDLMDPSSGSPIEAQRLIVEYDGAFHWEQRGADDRREAMRALGWTVMVLSAADYYKTPERAVAKVRSALGKFAA